MKTVQVTLRQIETPFSPLPDELLDITLVMRFRMSATGEMSQVPIGAIAQVTEAEARRIVAEINEQLARGDL